ncbi:hypothetical protein ZEAMMB73_Zm00001d022054 [Zea mays]|uniref:SERRATE/Ars2 N-terminal domain-containing protein n=1 Tax=Zea mays TaxID=4577 RepID=A0A1D6IIZ3_MAIZE|nr:hypothetical protein ZEAMMB73_Zm00001d022054 [Zea mays]
MGDPGTSANPTVRHRLSPHLVGYEEYKSEYITTQKKAYFDLHKDEDWLRNKYHLTNLENVIESYHYNLVKHKKRTGKNYFKLFLPTTAKWKSGHAYFSFSCKEFDENILRKVFELYYENGLLDLSYAPDVGDYLVCEDTSFVPGNKDQAPIPECMMGTEVEKRLNGQTYFSFSCKEFDENLLRKVFELYYENGLLDLSYAPDVGDYLVCEDTSFVPGNKDQAPIPEGMMGTEVEKRLNGQVNFYIFVLLGSNKTQKVSLIGFSCLVAKRT